MTGVICKTLPQQVAVEKILERWPEAVFLTADGRARGEVDMRWTLGVRTMHLNAFVFVDPRGDVEIVWRRQGSRRTLDVSIGDANDAIALAKGWLAVWSVA